MLLWRVASLVMMLRIIFEQTVQIADYFCWYSNQCLQIADYFFDWEYFTQNMHENARLIVTLSTKSIPIPPLPNQQWLLLPPSIFTFFRSQFRSKPIFHLGSHQLVGQEMGHHSLQRTLFSFSALASSCADVTCWQQALQFLDMTALMLGVRKKTCTEKREAMCDVCVWQGNTT